MNNKSLAIQIELRLSSPQPSGAVVLINTGSAGVRVWRTGNQWGDTVLSFEVVSGGRTWRIVRRPQEYTRNVPSSLLVPAGDKHKWPFDLGDGTWEARVLMDRSAHPDAQLVAIYDVPRSAEAVTHGVWAGQLRSEPVPLNEAWSGLPQMNNS